MLLKPNIYNRELKKKKKIKPTSSVYEVKTRKNLFFTTVIMILY